MPDFTPALTPQVSANPAADGLLDPEEPMLRWFRYAHLPKALQDVSMPFAVTAVRMVDTLSRSAERTVALRKLLESKDAAVRARIFDIDLQPVTLPPQTYTPPPSPTTAL